MTAYGKQAPELVIASHYDDDHISGLQPLMTPFGNAVQHLWAFDTQNLYDSLAKAKEDDSLIPSENDVAAGAAYLNKTSEISTLIESIKKEQDLLKYAQGQGIKTVQPVALPS